MGIDDDDDDLPDNWELRPHGQRQKRNNGKAAPGSTPKPTPKTPSDQKDPRYLLCFVSR